MRKLAAQCIRDAQGKYVGRDAENMKKTTLKPELAEESGIRAALIEAAFQEDGEDEEEEYIYLLFKQYQQMHAM